MEKLNIKRGKKMYWANTKRNRGRHAKPKEKNDLKEKPLVGRYRSTTRLWSV